MEFASMVAAVVFFLLCLFGVPAFVGFTAFAISQTLGCSGMLACMVSAFMMVVVSAIVGASVK